MLQEIRVKLVALSKLAWSARKFGAFCWCSDVTASSAWAECGRRRVAFLQSGNGSTGVAHAFANIFGR